MNPFASWHFALLGYPASIASPAYFLLLGVAVFAAWLTFRTLRQRRERIDRLLAPRMATLLAPGISKWRPVSRYGLSTLALALLCCALAEPQCGSQTEVTKRRGIDVVVALDASKSMLARDVLPSRLERAKLELATLLDALKGDRIGLVVFAGDAFVQCPLTSDYAAAKMFLRAVDPAQMQQGGTNIGSALLTAKQVLDNADRGSKDRVIILISDGEDLSGDEDSALDAIKDAEIKLFSVGIGSERGEPIPLFDRHGEMVGYKKDSAGQTILSKLDRTGLTKIAEATGGEFFYQAHGVAIGGVAQRIDAMQKNELESRMTVRYVQRFQWFAVPAILALIAAALIPAAARRRA